MSTMVTGCVPGLVHTSMAVGIPGPDSRGWFAQTMTSHISENELPMEGSHPFLQRYVCWDAVANCPSRDFPTLPLDRTTCLDELEGLREIAQQREVTRQQWLQQWGEQFGPDSYALPLAPLRDRDLRVLETWFEQSTIAEILAEVRERLNQYSPVPCWEDDPLAQWLAHGETEKSLECTEFP